MTTPDTEVEDYRIFASRICEIAEEHSVGWKLMIEYAIKNRDTSRDTYWKERVRKEREEGQKVVYLILPLAKGYVHSNPHTSSKRYLEIAENYLTPLTCKACEEAKEYDQGTPYCPMYPHTCTPINKDNLK